uniref:Myosin phosphatase Rho interacting protein n=1 Tax=Scophthalmus maximus TaxID=52904 RepID=A0A8D2ZN71_SCOMX
MTPDLLNFKKGWMVKLDEQGQWKKYWFVLTDHSLRYYKDSIAEEASDLDGEIDLSTCYNVTEYQAQRNYGFQIHTQEGVHTLSAMTAGIRRNWIQAVMKNVRPSTAPDVASREGTHCGRHKEPGARAKTRRPLKTFDWAEFRPIAQALAQQRAQEAESLQADLGELERSRRREERRKRYESVTSTSAEHASVDEAGRTDCESGEGHLDPPGPTSLERQQRVEEVIEQHWRQVEKTPLREERRVPLPTAVQPTETAELEQLLENYKQGLQLRTAVEREHDVRTGYISPVSSNSLCIQCARPELVSSQAQSLTKKYQETKELLKLQEQKKRNMQAQLCLSLSHLPIKEPDLSEPQTSILESPPPEPVQRTVSILFLDSEEAIQELEDLIADKPFTLTGLGKVLKSHSCNQETTEKHQMLLEAWKYQHEKENETIRKSLAKAGENIREYEARLLTMEDLVGKVQKQGFESLKSPYGPLSEIENHSETNEVTVGMLSQRVELLMNENGALKQRCQEIVNQLTEADREIDRLKAELIIRQGDKQHHLVMEELKRLKAELAENQANAIDREYYERELNEKSLRLHEALVTLEELGNTLKDTEKKLQLKEATLKGLGFPTDYEEEEMQPETEQLKELLEASQAKLFEMVAGLQSTEQRCIELEARNSELMALTQETQKVSREKLAENEIRMLREKLEIEKGRAERTVSECVEVGKKQVDYKELVKQVVKEVEMKTEAINQVVEVLARVDVNVERMLSDLKSTLFGSLKEEPLCVSPNDMRLVVEGEFWSQLLGSSEMKPEETRHSSGRGVAEQMMAQKRLMVLIRGICPQAQVDSEAVTEPEFASMYSWLDDVTNALVLKELTETLEAKSNGLKQIASKIMLDKDGELLSMALASFEFGWEQKQPSEYLLEALKEAYVSYVIIRLKYQHEKELKQKQTEVQICSLDCPNCPKLREVAIDLQCKLADLQSQLSEASLKTATRPQTLIQIKGEPIDSLDKTIELHDMIARHMKELTEVKDHYEQEAEKMREEIAKASETLRLRSEENVKEINSLTNCMENLEAKHKLEMANLVERFDREMEELRSMMSPVNPDRTLAGEDTALHHTPGPTSTLKQRIQELVTQVSVMTEAMRRRDEQVDVTTQRLKYEKDLENLKATCERGFAAMEDSHQRVIDELQRKHQRELENLHEEKERLLAEETAATIAAIEAMKNAHRTELEKELDRARKANNNAENADIDEIHRQHEEELCSFQREIEVLSEQYSQKCLENAHLAQALEAERQALRQCQRENQELNAHNQELNNRLAAEITKMRSMTSEDGLGDMTTIQGKELYEFEVMLRVKESEVQYLKQEINSLKDELQSAQRDKKYSTDKYKDIYTELSIVKAKAERDLGRLRDQLQLAHEALGEQSLEDVERGGYGMEKNTSEVCPFTYAERSRRLFTTAGTLPEHSGKGVASG